MIDRQKRAVNDRQTFPSVSSLNFPDYQARLVIFQLQTLYSCGFLKCELKIKLRSDYCAEWAKPSPTSA